MDRRTLFLRIRTRLTSTLFIDFPPPSVHSQELSDFIILVKSGLSVQKALLANLSSSLSAIIGAIIAVSVGQTSSDTTQLNTDVGRMLAFSSGILLYVAVGLGGELPKISGRSDRLGCRVLRLWGAVKDQRQI
jgi:hypothetical protein